MEERCGAVRPDTRPLGAAHCKTCKCFATYQPSCDKPLGHDGYHGCTFSVYGGGTSNTITENWPAEK